MTFLAKGHNRSIELPAGVDLPEGTEVEIHSLDTGRAWSVQELNDAAEKLAGEVDPTKAQAVKEQIASGFYGRDQRA